MVHRVQIKGVIKIHENIYLESAIFNCSTSPQDNVLFLNMNRSNPLSSSYIRHCANKMLVLSVQVLICIVSTSFD